MFSQYLVRYFFVKSEVYPQADLSYLGIVVIVDVVSTLPAKQASLVQSNTITGTLVIDSDNSIRQVLSFYPLEPSFYTNPLDLPASRNSHIQVTCWMVSLVTQYIISFFNDDKHALITHVYNKTDSDIKYAFSL